MNIGDRIKEVRKEKKITLKELSDKTGYSSAYISQIENGKRDKPSHDFLQRVSESLDISMMYLTTGRKAVGDLTEEELKEQFAESARIFNEGQSKMKDSLKEDFMELTDYDLAFSETNFLYQAITFLKESRANDLVIITGMLKQYNMNKDIYHKTGESKELYDDIEEMKNLIEAVFSTRYGLAEYAKLEDD